MSDHLTPVVPITIAGNSYSLCFNLDAIAEAEEILDRPLLTGLRQRDVESPKISVVRALLFAGLHAKRAELTLEDVKSLVTRKNIAEVWGKVLEAWVAAAQEPVEDEPAEARPINASAS